LLDGEGALVEAPTHGRADRAGELRDTPPEVRGLVLRGGAVVVAELGVDAIERRVQVTGLLA
jgi:hypothetical protein